MDTPVLDTLILELPNTSSRAAFLALKRLEGELKYRIHTQGMDANNSLLESFAPKTIGRYSRAYSKIRQKAGRRIDKKDLEFFGNLRRSYTVGTFGNGHALGFTFDLARQIAEGQQRQTRTLIFTASKTERDTLLEILAENTLP